MNNRANLEQKKSAKKELRKKQNEEFRKTLNPYNVNLLNI